MQKGRGYRHAIPRNNLIENLYNDRVPWFMQVEGTFRKGLLILNMPTPNYLRFQSYHGATIEWLFQGTCSWNSVPLVSTASYSERPFTGEHGFTLTLDDSFGSTWSARWLLAQGQLHPALPFTWPLVAPVAQIIAGPLWDAGGARVRSLRYSLEPP